MNVEMSTTKKQSNLQSKSTSSLPSNSQSTDNSDFRVITPKKCFAYENLKNNISKLCLEYRELCLTGTIGSRDGMYIEGDIEKIPGDFISDIFKGAIIGTMATFEAFVGDLLDEAAKIIYLTKEKCSAGCTPQCETLEHMVNSQIYSNWINKKTGNSKENKKVAIHVKEFLDNPERQAMGVQFHLWNERYTNTLLPKEHHKFAEDGSFTDFMLKQQPFKYRYIIYDDKTADFIISRTATIHSPTPSEHRQELRTIQQNKQDGPDCLYIIEQDESALCIILRLFYGIRCIMAHGTHYQTFKKGAFWNFPSCETCKGNQTMNCAEAVLDMVCHYNKYVERLDRDMVKEAEKAVRHIPQKSKFDEFKKKHIESSTTDQKKVEKNWNDALYILESYFKKFDDSESSLSAPYAFYHMIRVFFLIKETKRKTFMTYRQLVRINQFIHVLAFRMHLAVAGILIKHYGFVNGVWSVTAEGIKTKIEEFEEEHKETVEKAKKTLQHDQSSKS